MKANIIFKTLALATTASAMMLFTACGTDDDIIENAPQAPGTETVSQKGYALSVTVNVTRQSDDATKATYNESTKQLEFSPGDKLFVVGSHETADEFAGTLVYNAVNKNFSGTIYTKNLYEGTADALFTSAIENHATLLPAGYEGYGCLSISGSGYDAQLNYNKTKAFALTMAAALEQFSYEYGSYTDGTGFVLEPQRAIVNFTVSGLTPNKVITVNFDTQSSVSDDDIINGTVTVGATGDATFAIGLDHGVDLDDTSLYVDENDVTLVAGAKQVVRGHIYNIARSAVPRPMTSVTAADLGKVIGDDGKIYDFKAAATKAGVTAVAMIAYVGTASDCAHALAIALEDAATSCTWDKAASAVSTWAESHSVTGGTWRLPSEKDWQYMFNGSYQTPTDHLRLDYFTLSNRFNKAGGTALTDYRYYWSSTLNDSSHPWYVANEPVVNSLNIGNVTYDIDVRAVFAF